MAVFLFVDVGLWPKADICFCTPHVRFGGKADEARSADDKIKEAAAAPKRLVSALKHCRRMRPCLCGKPSTRRPSHS